MSKYTGILDRLEILVDRMNQPETYSLQRRERYHALALKQIAYLQEQLDWEEGIL